MTKAQLKVHTENILPIIKKWLYSEKDIFIRELVSNACDALGKCRVLREKGEVAIADEALKIEVRIDKENRKLIFSDTGIGMTAEEVEKYIAQIAFSGAEEFLSKYKTDNEKEQIIGHFGLGFYSAYMVSQKVTIETLSYKENAEPVLWSCDGGTEYDIDKGSRAVRGTDIILDIDAENDEFLDESKVKAVLQEYCSFLPFPIYLNESHINSKEPLWLKPASSCSEQEYIDFYHTLYPMDPDPIFWIHLNVDYPFNLKGILYFPKVQSKFEWNDSHVKLFCNRVFVSNDCKGIIPEYLAALKGAIDSPDIPLNVSRSYLQMDRTVRQLAVHVSKKVADKLSSSYESDKEAFVKIWPEIELIVKLGMIQDEKFNEKASSCLIWKNTQNTWTTVEEYTERASEELKTKIFYTADAKQDASFLKLYTDKHIEVLCLSSPLDTTLMSSLESKKPELKFQRIDGNIDEVILDKAKDKTLLDAEGKTEAVRLSELVKEKLSGEVDVEAKSLASDTLPGFVLIDENMRRMKEYLSLSRQTVPSAFLGKKTFVVNTNSKLMNSLPKLNQKNPDLAKDLVIQLYELSLLSQKELDPSELSQFIERSNRVLEELVSKDA